MDTVYEGTWYFGANSYIAGQVVGEYLAEMVKKNWGGQIDAIVGVYYVGGGEVVMDRVTGAVDALKSDSGLSLPGDDKIYIFDAGSSDQTLTAKQTATDFLTANPDLRHIVFATHNDETGLGVYAGIEASGRQSDCYLISTGGDTPYHEAVRRGAGDVWIASAAFSPELYGDQVIPMAIDILEGKDVPMEVFLNHFPITPYNLDEFYPE